MLSILPFEHLSSSQRDSERPFKSYPRGSSSQSAAHLSYSPYSAPFIRHHHKLPGDSMDLRATQPHHPYHDMTAATAGSHQIKQEMDMHYNGFSSHNAYHSNYSMPSMSMSSAAASSLYSASFGASNTTSLSGANGHGIMSTAPHLVGQTTPTSPPLPSADDKPSSALNASTGSPGTHSSADSASPSSDHKPGSVAKKRAAPVPEDLKDDTYWDKRKKNNDSAKRSRESRRMKEEQIAMRVVYLEQENLQLRTELSLLKSEIEKLRCMLYNS